MPQTIDQFLANVSPTIRSRGQSYFIKGAFELLEEDYGNFFFTVFGTDVYEVSIGMSENAVVSYHCDCPYDQGPVCKHIVACLYSIKGAIDESENKPKVVPKENKETVSIAEILKKASKEELLEFVVSLTNRNHSLKSDVLAAFSQYSSLSTEELVISHFKSIFREDRDGWNYRGNHFERDATKVVGSLINHAKQHIAERQFEKAFITCVTVFNILSSAMDNYYRFENDAEELVDLILLVLTDIGHAAEDSLWSSKIIDYCISELEKDSTSEFSYDSEFLFVIIDLCKTETHIETFAAYLHRKNKQGIFNDYYNAQAIELLAKICGQDRANDFILNNIDKGFIRKKAIEISIEKNDFIEARNLALGGFQTKLWSHNKDWKDIIIKTSLKLGETETAYAYAKELLFTDSNTADKYFSILLSIVGKENFDSLIDELKNDINKIESHSRVAFENFIYIKTSNWDALLSNVRARCSLFSITMFEKYLLEHKRQAYLELYVEVLCDFVDKNLGRDKYIEACTHLKKFKAWGEYTLLNEMNDEFKRSFKNRRALMEELAKV